LQSVGVKLVHVKSDSGVNSETEEIESEKKAIKNKE
jgi:hypothetical protein